MKIGSMLFGVALLLTGHVMAGDGYADLVSKIQGGVVNIQVTQKAQRSRMESPYDFFFNGPGQRGNRESRASGTGFIISEDGYIVTNRHVVSEADDIQVTLSSGRDFQAELIGTDDSMDVALIKIDATGLTALKTGDSEAMRIGDVVLALGYPLQLGFSVTSGIISGIGRDFTTGNFDVATYLQTDADITFGNSGGPLVNSKGEVIAINTMIIDNRETYGFSIPSNLFMHSVRQLREFGKVRRGALGVSISDLDEESKEYYKIDNGALIAAVTPGMPAEDAGVRRGDIILSIDGKQVHGSGDVIATISSKLPGADAQLKLLSEGKQRNVVVKLGDRSNLVGSAPGSPEAAGSSDPSDTGLGFSVAPLTGEAREQLGLTRDVEGLLIAEVAPDSLARRKGIRANAVLTHVDLQAVNSPRDLKKVLDSIATGKPVPVRVMEFERGMRGSSRTERTVFLRKQ